MLAQSFEDQPSILPPDKIAVCFLEHVLPTRSPAFTAELSYLFSKLDSLRDLMQHFFGR